MGFRNISKLNDIFGLTGIARQLTAAMAVLVVSTSVSAVDTLTNSVVITSDNADTAQDSWFTCALSPAEVAAGTQAYLNSASVTADNVTGLQPVEAAVCLEIVAPSLGLVKQVTSGSPYSSVGAVVNYSYLVTNTGGVALTEPLLITDNLISSASVICPAFSSIGNNDNFLDPSESITCTAPYSVTQVDINNGSVTNIARAQATNPGNASQVVTSPDSATAFANQLPALAIDKTIVSGDPYSAVGNTISYNYAVTNTGNSLLTGPITVSDDRIASVSCPAINTVGNADNNFDPGEAIICSASYTVLGSDLSAGSITNTATASATNPGSGSTITSPQDIETAYALGSVALIKTGSIVDTTGDSIFGNAGDTIDYSFTVTNVGGVTLNNITVNDPLVVVNGGSIATLAAGASDSSTFTATYTINGTDVINGQVSNQATVFATDINSNPVSDLSDNDSNTEDDPTITVLNGTISLVKTGVVVDTNLDLIVGNVGDSINYTFTVSNTGPVVLTTVTVTDPLVTVVGGPIATFAPAAVDNTTFTASYTITAGDVATGSVTNQATASGFGPSGNTVNDLSDNNSPTEDDPTITSFSADIALIKEGTVVDTSGDSVLGNVGDTIEYAFTVTNLGPTLLRNVDITDPLVAVNGGPLTSLVSGAVDNSTFTATYTITAADVTAGQVSNQATVDAIDPGNGSVSDISDDDSNTEDDPTIVVVGQTAALDFIKEADFTSFLDIDASGDLTAGDMFDYRFTVTNIGDVIVENVNLDETQPIALPLAGSNLTAINSCLVNGLTPAANGAITLNLTDSVVCSATYTIPDVPTLILYDSDPASIGSQLPNHAQVTATPLGGGTPVTVPSDNPDTPAIDDPTVVHVDLPPLANDDESLLNTIGDAVTLPLLNNDQLSDGSTPVANDVFVDLDPSTVPTEIGLVVPNEGTWLYDQITGEVTFTPDGALLGDPTPIVYLLVERSTNLRDGATLTVTYTLSNATISGNVFDDTSGSELAMSGVTVDLYADNDADGTLSAGDTLASGSEASANTAISGAAGEFSFTIFVPDNYLLVQTNAVGFNSVIDEDRTTPADEPNPVSNDDWLPVSVASGEVDDGNIFVDRQNSVTLNKTHNPVGQHNDVDLDGLVSAGDVLTFTVTALNNSAVAITNFVLTDTLAGISLNSGSCVITDQGTPGDTTNPPTESAGNSFQFASFGAGDTVACDFNYTVTTANEMTQCSIDNIAQASGDTISPVSSNISVPVSPAIPNAADDSFSFALSGHPAGTPFDYTILTNDRMRDGVTIVDDSFPSVSVELIAPAGATQVDSVTVTVPAEGTWSYANGVASFLAEPAFLSGSTMTPTPIQYRLIEDPTAEIPAGCQIVEDLATISFTMVTTPVTLSYFASEPAMNGDVSIAWQTEMEVGTLGYDIYARGEDGWFKINVELIPSSDIDSFEQQNYEMFFPAVNTEWFSMVEVSATEDLTVHGPYRLGREYGELAEQVEEMDWQSVRGEILDLAEPETIENSVNSRLQNLLDSEERAHRD